MNNPKRILIFSLMHYPFIGGAEIAVGEITKRLPHYEFDMVTLRLDRKLPRVERIGNVTLHRIGFVRRKPMLSHSVITFPLSLNKFLFPVTAFIKGLTLHRTRKYDAIWAIMAAYAGFAALAFKICRPKVPYILSLQEGDPIKHIQRQVRFIHPIWRLIFIKADIVQAISSYLAGFAESTGYKKSIEVVPNGVDLTNFKFHPYVSEFDHLKNMLGKRTYLSSQSDGRAPEPDDVLLVTSSRLVLKNGVADTILSLVYLPKHISLLVIGDGPLLPFLKQLVEDKNLADRVKFLGFVPHDELPKYLAVSDIFVRPSISEGFGNAFVEAMAMGLPVIATPVGGIVDFVFDPDMNPEREPTGLFCFVQNPKSVAHRVRLLLANKKLRDRIVHNAEKMVREKYDWNIVARDMDEKVFKQVIK